MLSKLSVISLAVAAASQSAIAADNLFISEYVEGSANNKAIELYNPSGSNVDLTNYQLSFYFNGNAEPSSVINLEGVLSANSTYVIADNDANEAILAVADLASNASFFNGDDAVVLSVGDQVLDSIGQVGVDPGNEWGSGDVSTKDNTIRRDPDNIVVDTIIDDAADLSSWLGFAKDDISDLGQFEGGDPIVPPPGGELVCNDPATMIHQLQGSGESTPLAGEVVEVEAVVTSVQQGLKGLFIQTPDADIDADSATSEGVFVYFGNSEMTYQEGDLVRLKAQVSEYQGATQLSMIEADKLCAANQAQPTAAMISLPYTDLSEFEAVEGMRVSFEQDLMVNEVYQLGRYGEVLLGSSRHYIGTQVAMPGDDANAVIAANTKDSIILDDGLTAQNPDVVRYPAPGLTAENTLRVGDSATNVTAIMHYGFNQYRLMPSETINFVATNPRSDAPQLTEADISLASFNVLNYFNGDGLGGGYPTDRGADSSAEFERQRAKIISAMVAIDADVYGLMELENDALLILLPLPT